MCSPVCLARTPLALLTKQLALAIAPFLLGFAVIRLGRRGLIAAAVFVATATAAVGLLQSQSHGWFLYLHVSRRFPQRVDHRSARAQLLDHGSAEGVSHRDAAWRRILPGCLANRLLRGSLVLSARRAGLPGRRVGDTTQSRSLAEHDPSRLLFPRNGQHAGSGLARSPRRRPRLCARRITDGFAFLQPAALHPVERGSRGCRGFRLPSSYRARRCPRS